MDTWLPSTTVANFISMIYECLKSEVTWPDSTKEQWTQQQLPTLLTHELLMIVLWGNGHLVALQQLPTLLTHNIRVSKERSNLTLRSEDNSCQLDPDSMKEPWTPGCQRQQLPNFSYLQYTSVSRVKSLDPDSTKEQWTPGCPWQQLPTLLTYNIRVSQEWSHLILIVRRSNGHLVALDNSCQLYLLIIYECLKREVTWPW